MSFTAVSGHTTFTMHKSPHRCVLMLDDDLGMQSMIAEYLESHDMEVAVGSSRSDMTRSKAIVEFDVIVLDLHLGREDGLDLLRELRARSDVPVIIITGHRLEEIDRVVGRKLGANDNLTKPFSLRELLISHPGRHPPVASGASGGGQRFDERAAPFRRLDARAKVGTLARSLGCCGQHYRERVRFADRLPRRAAAAARPRVPSPSHSHPSSPRIILTERGVGYVFTARVDTER